MSKALSNFRWRTREGQIMMPHEMETSHLFYSIRMIWNHTMPEHLQLQGGRYVSDWFHDPRRVKDALTHLSAELSRRDWKNELDYPLQEQFAFMLANAGAIDDYTQVNIDWEREDDQHFADAFALPWKGG